MNDPSDQQPIQLSASANNPSIVSLSSGGKEGESISVQKAEAPHTVSIEATPVPESVGEVSSSKQPFSHQDPISLSPVTSRTPSPLVAAATKSAPANDLPLSDEKILENKQGSPNKSLTWMALWCIRKLLLANKSLIVMNGHARRVFEDRTI